jgi:hypothetical protein
VATVHVADIIATAMKMGSSGELFVPPVEPEAWESLGLPVDSIPSIVEESEKLYNGVVKIVLESVR